MSSIDNGADEEDDALGEPLDPQTAQRLIREILSGGVFTFSKHCEVEMAADNLKTPDCVNVLRAGVVEQPEFDRGTWRYRVRTPRIVVVAAFRSSKELVVVTAWRI